MKVAINYQEYPNIDQERQIFHDAFGEIEIVESKTLDTGVFIKEAEGADGVLVQFVPINREVIEALTNCRGYVRYGIGYDNIDVEYAASKGKMVANVQIYCLDEVSNHAMALLLALNRKILQCHQYVVEKKYDLEKIMPVNRLIDCTLGIVGIGNIGRQFADKMRPLVKRIIFYDPYVDTYPGCEKVDDIKELFAESDYISLHPLLNSSTKHLANRELLESMKPTAYLINTSRGPVVDEEALIEVLRQGKIGGAALDVFESEPLSHDSPLLNLPNVILTHHAAWYSEGSIRELQRKGAEQLVQILKGQTPEYSVI